MSADKIRIVCISDTHNHRPGEGFTLPKGDVLIHAGDLTNNGTLKEVEKAMDWISRADFAVKIVVAGNHDLCLDPAYAAKHDRHGGVDRADVETSRLLTTANSDIVYLRHAAAVIRIPEKRASFRVFGSPYSPRRSQDDVWAFQYEAGAADAVWSEVPDGTDVVISHTPPAGFCDTSRHWKEGGCGALTRTLSRIRPMLHVCGHCHEGRGAVVVRWSESESAGGSPSAVGTWIDPGAGNKKQSLLDLCGQSADCGAVVLRQETGIVNASIMATSYGGRRQKTFNKPMVVDVGRRRLEDEWLLG